MESSMRIVRDGRGVRIFSADYNQGEVAYASLRVNGLAANVEFPSDWHEYRRGWLTLGLGFVRIGLSFPWKKAVPDNHQCSGPRYGFYFFEDHLVLLWGHDTGRSKDPKKSKFIYMPWSWKHRQHDILSEPETHLYRYVLRSGEVQERMATIKVEQRRWTRWWLPWRKVSRYIDIEFSGEVGERSGSWKGGVLGCSYNMLPNELAVDCLRRMERERTF